MPHDGAEPLPGTLGLTALKTLEAVGPPHGYGLARRVGQAGGGLPRLNRGTIYPAPLRLEQMGRVGSRRGTPGNNRRANYYSITRGGRRRPAAEGRSWRRARAIMAGFLEPAGGDA